ncbi:MAG: hypothetical protein ACJ75H_15900 [Thermoanaerobaculia bacterium]
MFQARGEVWSLAFALGLALAATAGAAGVELVSVADPVPDSFGNAFSAAVGADGRYVAFFSNAPNLASGQVDGNATYDLFLRDRVTGATTQVTHSPAASSAASALEAGLSADGRYLAFTGTAGQIFLYDRVTGTTTLVSHAAGQPGAAADSLSFSPRVSADGNWIAFASLAGNLLAEQNEAGPDPDADIFLYHRPSGALTLVSHKNGAPLTTASGISFDPEISADGGFVVFGSTAGDLVPGQSDANSAGDVFLFQRATGAVTLVSHASGSATRTPDFFSGNPRLSADGRWVAFVSLGRNLVAGQIENASTLDSDAFLFDRVSGQTRLVSHTSASPLQAAGILSYTQGSGGMVMSADGRFVAFVSAHPALVPGQVNLGQNVPNVFLYDRVAGTTALVSHHRDSATTATNAASGNPSLSSDGRFVAFRSAAVDLVPKQTDLARTDDVFVYDRVAKATALASHVRESSTTAANLSSAAPRISPDGNTVLFESYATNLAEGQVDANGFLDLFAFDRKSGEVASLTRSDPELPAVTPWGPSTVRGLSADGRFVLFESRASGLIPGQIDAPDGLDDAEPTGTWDVFLRDRTAKTTTLLSHTDASPVTALGYTASPVLSADGRFAAYVAGNRSSSSPNRLYLHDRETGQRVLVNHEPATPNEPFGNARNPALSADGRWLAFACTRCNLVPGQQDGQPDRFDETDVYLFDRVAGAVVRVSHADGLPLAGGDADSKEPRISADGRFVVFASDADNLVPGQTAPERSFHNLFVFDRATGAVALVTHAAGAPSTPVDQGGYEPEITADGAWIVYRSPAANLVAGQVDAADSMDVFLYDRAAGTSRLVSHAALSPVQAGNAYSGYYSFESYAAASADGRWIVFESVATDLVAGLAAPAGSNNAYLYDRLSGAVSLVATGIRDPRISPDGGRIAFQATEGQIQQLDLVERATGARTRVGRVYRIPPAGLTGAISLLPRFSTDGRKAAFTSDSPGFAAGDLNGNWDVFLYDADATPGGPIAVTPCIRFDTRQPGDGPALRSNAPSVIAIAGSCGVPGGIARVTVRITALQSTGDGNLRLYQGGSKPPSPPAGILRFGKGQAATQTFDLPLGGAARTLTILPFVRGNGRVDVVVEILAYTP